MEVLHNKIPKSHGLHPLEQVTKLWQELNTMLEFVGHKIARMQGFTDVMGQEVHGLVQTVYTLVAVRDNGVNHEVAQASLRMAEDCRKVAILARQDSTVMRVIAGATLIFLPANFVATLFSTDFFDFSSSSTYLISKWIWLYIVVTAALTGAVMLAWRQLSRRRDRETAQLLHLRDPELLRAIVADEEGGDGEAGSTTSGVALRGLRNRLRRRTQTEQQAGST